MCEYTPRVRRPIDVLLSQMMHWREREEERQREREKSTLQTQIQNRSAILPLLILPGQHEVGIWVVGPRAGWAPLDCVDFLIVSLKVMNTVVLFYTPDLSQK